MNRSSPQSDPHPAILAALKAIPSSGQIPPTGEAGNPTWLFNLPELYKTCCTLDSRVQKLGYRRFRQLLYANPTNEHLSRHGLLFDIAENLGHVDRNLYRLIATGGGKPGSG